MSKAIRADIAHILSEIGVNIEPHDNISTAFFIVLCCAVAFITYVMVRWGLLKAVNAMLKRSHAIWGSVIVKHAVFEKLSLIIPAVVLNLLIPLVLDKHAILSGLIDRVLSLWLIVALIRSSYAFLDASNNIADIKLMSRDLPIKSFVQLFKLVIFFIGLIIAISVIFDRSPVYFLSGLGVATGLVLLVFRDTILGFVAGIQLSANQMVKVGDWIQMDKYGANGSIEEVSLTTVKVKNWDNTVTNIPAYALVQDSFINWRQMQESGGRRIKRSILIDIDTIKFIDNKEEDTLSSIDFVPAVITQIKQTLNPHSGLTNIAVFRGYLEAYLKQHPKIRQDMTFLVRELEPTPQGLPIQIYVFVNDTRWAFYEAVQSDIFDHIFAMVPKFGLAAYQSPAASDLRSLQPLPIDHEQSV
ncbi:mechanosensitive ion channel family protein [Photobacterium leiognathi]|uniref:Mechanosensitive ion channel protein MscS n=1 Tax=Photobacterium leiognathi TaxID=553611 RepID=A0ABX5GEI5_PHOLE|nr:mechanosensitive ion channel domain-containing protein [Photobacterium leiognathi]KJF87514.1 mechanosensitive ion channel protein MscS [Photobacterium leiognathi]PSV80925.1 mechanosensitive ion channel protein MscS [Photobacterium leiognathi]